MCCRLSLDPSLNSFLSRFVEADVVSALLALGEPALASCSAVGRGAGGSIVCVVGVSLLEEPALASCSGVGRGGGGGGAETAFEVEESEA